MKHASYVETVSSLAESDWGVSCEAEKDAQANLIKSVDLSGACLLRIVRTMDRFLAALTGDAIDELANNLGRKAECVLGEFIASREKKHGPCPSDVRRWLMREMQRWIGGAVMNGSVPKWVPEPELPPKGTIARREYDKWMRVRVGGSSDGKKS